MAGLRDPSRTFGLHTDLELRSKSDAVSDPEQPHRPRFDDPSRGFGLHTDLELSSTSVDPAIWTWKRGLDPASPLEDSASILTWFYASSICSGVTPIALSTPDPTSNSLAFREQFALVYALCYVLVKTSLSSTPFAIFWFKF